MRHIKEHCKVLAVQRARLECHHATAILRVYMHDPDVQGVLQQLTLAIDDASKLLDKLTNTEKKPS